MNFVFTGFIVYSCVVVIVVLVLIIRFAPRYGQTHMVVYVGICSMMGSLTVCSTTFTVRFNLNKRKFILYCLFVYTGYECQSIGHCLEAHIFWNEPICICSDLVLYSCCGNLLSPAVELPEQGNLSVFMLVNSLCTFRISDD